MNGLPAAIRITNAEPTDQLRVDGLAGDDVIEAAALTADAISLTIDGGEGDDLLLGGAGNDVILGGPGDDVLLGGPGLDVARRRPRRQRRDPGLTGPERGPAARRGPTSRTKGH